MLFPYFLISSLNFQNRWNTISRCHTHNEGQSVVLLFISWHDPILSLTTIVLWWKNGPETHCSCDQNVFPYFTILPALELFFDNLNPLPEEIRQTHPGQAWRQEPHIFGYFRHGTLSCLHGFQWLMTMNCLFEFKEGGTYVRTKFIAGLDQIAWSNGQCRPPKFVYWCKAMDFFRGVQVVHVLLACANWLWAGTGLCLLFHS